MVTLLHTVAFRLAVLVILSSVLGIIATPLPMFEALKNPAGLLERRANPEIVNLHIKRGSFEANGSFAGLKGSGQNSILRPNDEFLLLFNQNKGLRAMPTEQLNGDVLPRWKLVECVHKTNSPGLFLGTLNFATVRSKGEVLGHGMSMSTGEIYGETYSGVNELQVYTQVEHWILDNPSIKYMPDPKNQDALHDLYSAVMERERERVVLTAAGHHFGAKSGGNYVLSTAVMEPAEYKGKWDVKELLGKSVKWD
ncbi:hypothetical protein C8R41DRAFT_919451 [Lentinula lateritia]|uniref:Uncharacterized protein n=1 Tax=Lentinula lateritia TaxID=40482 RepID=A0ABQ8VJT6_9AGAR|nr:hypothetical protein C8R41DRAFT_919451 [Lentinula lateritia]